MNVCNSQVMALELEQGLTETPLKLECLEIEGQNKPTSTKRGPKLADLSSEATGTKTKNDSSIFPSMADGTKNKSSPHFPSFSFSPNISVCTQHFFHVCQECFSNGNINPFIGDLKYHFVFPNIHFILCCYFLGDIRTIYESCHTAQRNTVQH